MNFSPSIPYNGTFTVQVVYQYSSAVLPDDPGFNADNLELVSYDPTTQQLLTYPSVVDTVGQTVSATVGGLAPYYALAVPASTLGTALSLPIDPQGEQTPATLGLVNAGTVPANTSLTAFASDGTTLAANPTTAPLQPGQQTAQTFGNLGAPSLGLTSWVQAYANVPGTVGVALLDDPGGLESLPFTASATTLVVPGVELTATQSTELDIANATPFSNGVTLELHDTTGALIDSYYVTLPAKGSFSSEASPLFPDAAATFQGYIIVRGAERLTAAVLTRPVNSLSALNGQPLTLGTVASTTLYAPHFQIGGGTAARLDIVNPTTVDAHVTIQANKDDGTLLAKNISVTIAAGTQYWSDIATAFALSPTGFTAGSITVTSDLSGLVGDVTFGDRTGPVNHQTSIALGPPLTSAIVPYVVNTAELPMTLYVMNAGSGTATVNVSVLGADGSVTGGGTLTIPAEGRSVQALSQLAAASAGQTGGAIQINSNQPVAAVAMILPASLLSDFASIPAVASSLVVGASSHPAFFTGEDYLGSSIYYLQFPDTNLFGYYGYLSSSILYHQDLGYEAFVAATGGQIYFYDFATGHWWYSSASLFPYLYDFTLNTFIYYFPDTKNAGHYTSNPRYFSNLTTGKIFTM